MTGPVQVLIVGFDTPTFSGEVLAELDRLRRSGIVKLLDLLLVRRGEDGAIETVDLPESVTTAGLGEVTLALLGTPAGAHAHGDGDGDGEASSSTWSLEEAVPPGTTAAVALIEHVWAQPLRSAISRAGGRTLEETWLGAADLDALEGLLAGRSH